MGKWCVKLTGIHRKEILIDSLFLIFPAELKISVRGLLFFLWLSCSGWGIKKALKPFGSSASFATGWNRTNDTWIFSPLLYQLSYSGLSDYYINTHSLLCQAVRKNFYHFFYFFSSARNCRSRRRLKAEGTSGRQVRIPRSSSS